MNLVRKRGFVGSRVLVMLAAISASQIALGEGTVAGWGSQIVLATPLEDARTIAAGGYHSLAVRSDGTVVGWGEDHFGQATPPEGLRGVVAIAAGQLDSLALKSDGTVVGWGYPSTLPAGLTGVVAIAAGFAHSLALRSDGSVVGWGLDDDGQATAPAGLTGVMATAPERAGTEGALIGCGFGRRYAAHGAAPLERSGQASTRILNPP